MTTDFPETAAAEEVFSIFLTVANRHQEPVTLGNLDSPVFDVVEIIEVKTRASADSPVGGLGSQAWLFNQPPEPRTEFALEVSMKALGPG